MLPEPSTLAWHAANEWLEESSIALLKSVLLDNLCGKVALVSSFGAEAAVLLHLVSRVNPSVPVIFLDTQMMFAETLDLSARPGGASWPERCACHHAGSVRY